MFIIGWVQHSNNNNEMVRVYMLLWPFFMIFASSFLVFLVFIYKWDSVDAEMGNSRGPAVLLSPPHQQSSWMTDESFDRLGWNYGVIVDAGSSGSRVFVYVWPPHSGDPHELIKIRPLLDDEKKPVVKKVSPGLSSFGEAPENATTHMQSLLDYVVEHIPPSKHKETSLFIMATAGLRLIPEKRSSAVLSRLRTELPKLYDFIILDQHIEIISGKWEGIYSWIAVNYVLGRLTHGNYNENMELNSIIDKEANKTIHRPKSVGMIDMGGGSVQIAFELTQGDWEKVPRNEEHLIHSVNLGCLEHDLEHTYRLYVATFLGITHKLRDIPTVQDTVKKSLRG